MRAALFEEPGEPGAQPAESLLDGAAQVRIGGHVGILGESPHRAPPQRLSFPAQVRGDPLGDSAGTAEIRLRPGAQVAALCSIAASARSRFPRK